MCYHESVHKTWTIQEGGERLQITLKAARVNAGITQAKAAETVNTTARTVASWESGKTLPDIASFKTLCKLYGVSMDAISFLPNEST